MRKLPKQTKKFDLGKIAREIEQALAELPVRGSLGKKPEAQLDHPVRSLPTGSLSPRAARKHARQLTGLALHMKTSLAELRRVAANDNESYAGIIEDFLRETAWHRQVADLFETEASRLAASTARLKVKPKAPARLPQQADSGPPHAGRTARRKAGKAPAKHR